MNTYEINLLQKEKNKVAGKLLHFVLYYFRYIIVVTQIIVIAVFFFRFREDQKVIDLKESFRQRQQILAVTAPIIDESREIALKTDKVKVQIDQQDAFLDEINFVLDSIPQDVILDRLGFTSKLITLSGESTNVFSVRSLHRKLSLKEGFETAEIRTLDRISAGSFEFVIEIPQADNESK